jgi:hypothetical protein
MNEVESDWATEVRCTEARIAELEAEAKAWFRTAATRSANDVQAFERDTLKPLAEARRTLKRLAAKK